MAGRPLPFDPVAEARRQWTDRGWDEAAIGMAAVTSIMRAQQIFEARVDRELRRFELTFARFELLVLLYFSRRRELPMGKAGQRLQVHPTSVTSAIDRLERQGFARRAPHPTDRRTTLAQLTASGERVVERAIAHLNATVFADPGLSSRKSAELVALLAELRRGAGDFAAGG